MNNLELWISGGAICQRPQKPDGTALSDRRLLHDHSLVKLECASAGTTVHWVMFGANWSSLMFLSEFIVTCEAPVTLRYFNGGWFEETIDNVIGARQRLDVLFSKADVRLSQRTFVVPFDEEHRLMPEILRVAFNSGSIPDDKAVICKVDMNAELHSVESVGRNSALASIWGVVPVSYPCQTGHSYDKVVSRSYFKAIAEGRPIYDHVLAAMVKPDSEVQWMHYQRVILSEKSTLPGEAKVKVICEIAPVDISLL